jgi:CheY-like chemotaxis protein
MGRIAIVDDDVTLTDLLVEILGELGYQATAYYQSEGTFALLGHLQPDLILVDGRIEGPQSGWTLLDLLRADEATTAIPLVVCSADLAQLEEREEWLREQGIGVLLKPFDLDELEQLVAQLLSRSSVSMEQPAS